MRILLVHNRYRSNMPGGEDAVFDQQRVCLSLAGHEVFVYQRSNDELFDPSFRTRFRAIWSLIDGSGTYDELLQMIRDVSPDVIHAHNLFPLIRSTLYKAVLKTKTPLVQTIHNYRWSCAAATHFRRGGVCTRCSPDRFRDSVLRRCYRRSILLSWAVGASHSRMWRLGLNRGAVSNFIALTPFAANRLTEAGVREDCVSICPNWTPVKVRNLERSSLGSEYAVFSGRLSDEKGVMTLLEAWRDLRDIELRVIGDGPARVAMTAFIRKYDLPVRLLGYLPPESAVETVSRARIQVVPSEWFEGMPLVVLEAWALGVPVIASRIGGLKSMISDGVDGLLFESGAARSLAFAVRRAWDDPISLDRWSRNGQRRVTGEYSAAAGVAQLERIYRKVILRQCGEGSGSNLT